MQWQIQSEKIPNNLEELRAILLSIRGIEDAVSFFNPPHPNSIVPASVGIDAAAFERVIVRLRDAGAQNQKVLIFGDYDADGICATTVLWQSLHELGCEVRPFIPDRIKHGYGITPAAIVDATADFKPDVVVTVDNGIVAFPAFEQLKAMGIDAVLTDHHQPEKGPDGESLFPPVLGIVHTTKLCGTTVAWLLSKALTPELATKQLDLCAIATVADLVPLQAENRSFVFHGLRQLQKTENRGLRALLSAARISPPSCTTQTIGYMLGPRINAMGRLAHGMDALRLLCTKNQENAERLARLLDSTNLERQALTDDLFQEALSQAEAMQHERILIVHSELFHEGVVGLLAGKLVERFHKPAIAISVHETIAKASARSISGVNIVELIRTVRDDLLEVGGHPMAAGFGVLPEKIAHVRLRLQELAREVVTEDQLARTVSIATELPTELISPELGALLDTFEPFGKDAEQPIFAIRGLSVTAVKPIGKEGKHLKINFAFSALDAVSTGQSQQRSVTALYWGGSRKTGELKIGSIVSVAARFEWNEWNGRKELQIVIVDLVSNI